MPACACVRTANDERRARVSCPRECSLGWHAQKVARGDCDARRMVPMHVFVCALACFRTCLLYLYLRVCVCAWRDRSKQLVESSKEFETSAKDLKCKFIKEKWKLIAIIVAVVVVIIIIIAVSVAFGIPAASIPPIPDTTVAPDTTVVPGRQLLQLVLQDALAQSVD